MRVIITGATGNVGSAVVRALAADDVVDEIVGLARRDGGLAPSPKVRFVTGDVRDRALLDASFAGADAVVHLAWSIQPSHDRDHTQTVNVDGSRQVFEAAAAAGVATLVHASSVGAYTPVADRRPRDESWGTDGIPSSFYSRDKAAAERVLDAIEQQHPDLRVVRLRPALIFQRSAAQEIRRLFAGPLLPSFLLRPQLLPLIPDIAALRFQAVHSDDVAEAYRMAVTDASMRGAYNVAADPLMGTRTVAEIFGARTFPVPLTPVRVLAQLSWRAHLQPSEAGWVDLAAHAPVMDAGRIRAAGWRPRVDGVAALRELLAGMRDRAGGATPPLAADAGGSGRVREVATGVGSRT